ncbi:MAG: ribosome assembly cofactor RimP [Paludibacteraceae bacterium]|nr:ribosome assembly cofactor RimP [Paludibacteraceae bacterium]
MSPIIMIQPTIVADIVKPYLEGKNYELITCSVSPDNRILVEIDSFDGVDVDFCVELSHYVQDHLDREAEDYELEVGSVSITDPFKTPMQYHKNLGNEVELLTKDGRKLHGVLTDVGDEDFEVETEVMVKNEGDKKKHKELQQLRFGFDDVKYCKYDLKV